MPTLEQHKIKPSLSHAVKELLQERQALLALFCETAGQGESVSQEDRTQKLQQLCQLLIDYSALWQFEITNLLLDIQEPDSLVQQVLAQSQPLIMQASAVALDFNDDLEAGRLVDHRQLENKLSLLGESLAERMEAEDKVISAL